MAITLSNTRAQVLALLGETVINNSSWYYNSTTPYYNIDYAVNASERDIGQALLESGCEDAMVIKSAAKTYPADTENYAWSSLDNTGALPGTKILQIQDTTTDLPQYIRMEYFSRKDIYDPGSIYDSPRYRELSQNVSSTVAIMYKDTISIYPKFGSARSLTFFYVPKFGQMAATPVNSVLPDDAENALSFGAANILLQQLQRDNSQMESMYSRSLMSLINTLQSDRATPFRSRPRFKGITQ